MTRQVQASLTKAFLFIVLVCLFINGRFGNNIKFSPDVWTGIIFALSGKFLLLLSYNNQSIHKKGSFSYIAIFSGT